MHFGLDPYLGHILYAAAVAALLASVFWRPIVGIFYLLPLIPLQTIRYRLNDFPLGTSILGIMLVGVALGVLRRRQPLPPRISHNRRNSAFPCVERTARRATQRSPPPQARQQSPPLLANSRTGAHG